MTRASILHDPPLALAAVALLGCVAVALPLLFGSGVEAVEAIRAPVLVERPVARILATEPVMPVQVAEAPPPAPQPPRLVQPARLPPALPDAEPDLRIAWLSVTAGYPPVELPALVVKAKTDRMALPRRKPARPARMPAIEIVARAPDISTEAAPLAPMASAPRIALVVTAAGLHEATTRQAIRTLPDGITLAFAPVGAQSGALAEIAIADGHTVLVEIPMEAMTPRRGPGEALTLRTGDTGAANLAKLDKALSSVPGASGISSYLGAKFTASEQSAAPVIDRIAARGLFVFENQPGERSRLGALARARDIAYATASTALDGDRNTARMLDRLAALEARARREGVAIGVATAYRESISALERWVVEAQRRGIVFVPVTRLDNAG